MIPISDTQPTRNTPLMTYGIIAASIAVFLVQASMPEAQLRSFVYFFGLVPDRSGASLVEEATLPVVWPWLTHMFLHGSWMHLIGNLWTLFIFGDNVEDRMGRGRFLLFYILCGLAAGAGQWAMHPHSSVPMIGASGAIAGVMGAYLCLCPRSQVVLLVPLIIIPWFVTIPAAVYLVIWFGLQWISGAADAAAMPMQAGVAWWAHVGGFAAGFLLHRLFKQPDDRWRPPIGYSRRAARDF